MSYGRVKARYILLTIFHVFTAVSGGFLSLPLLPSSRYYQRHHHRSSRKLSSPPLQLGTQNTITKRDDDDDKDGATSVDDQGVLPRKFDLTYSPNFRRHVVRDGSTNKVIQSFVWLDDALEKYPDVTRRPLVVVDDSKSTRNTDSSHAHRPQQQESATFNQFWVAGCGLEEGTAYPEYFTTADETLQNSNCLQNILLNKLKWFPQQVDKIFETFPLLSQFPCAILQERLEFLLAPLPADPQHPAYPAVEQQLVRCKDHMNSVSASLDKNFEALDWPLLLDQGYGAGLSVAQVSHALQSVPQVLLRLMMSSSLNKQDDSNVSNEGADLRATQLLNLYDQTPPVVFEIAQRQLDPYLTGADSGDIAALAFLHFKGWEWTQCRAIIQALHILSATNEPSWEQSQQKSGLVRSRFVPQRLDYLQMRLQIMPWHLHAMIKVHPALSKYSISLLKLHLNSLQSQLYLKSSQVRSIILRMQSLLGTSPASLEKRIFFWTQSVGLTIEQLQQVVLKEPVLLQFNVSSNFMPKLNFLRNKLQIDHDGIVALTLISPSIWSRSLKGRLEPITLEFCQRCSMSLADFGSMVGRVPPLLALNYETLRAKVDFLQLKLEMTDSSVRALLMNAPWLLRQSISGMDSKIDLLLQFENGKEVLQANPSLLLSTRKVLEQRLERSRISNSSVLSPLGTRDRSIVLLASDETVATTGSRACMNDAIAASSVSFLPNASSWRVEREFANVAQAAEYAGISLSNIRDILRVQRLWKGRRFVYARDLYKYTSRLVQTSDSRSTKAPAEKPSKAASVSSSVQGAESKPTQIQSNHPNYVNNFTRLNRTLTIFSSGRAYPKNCEVRGSRRAGGMALHIVDWGPNDWQSYEKLWHGQRVKLVCSNQPIRSCIFLWGYPYTRPSRPRCSLYVCRQALRIAREWIAREHEQDIAAGRTGPVDYDIVLVTDTSYVSQLLSNTSQLLEWGKLEQKRRAGPAAVNACSQLDVPMPSHLVNPDILYPLAQTWLHIMNQQSTGEDSTMLENARKVPEKRVSIEVKLTSALQSGQCPVNLTLLSQGALVAAKRMYDKS